MANDVAPESGRLPRGRLADVNRGRSPQSLANPMTALRQSTFALEAVAALSSAATLIIVVKSFVIRVLAGPVEMPFSMRSAAIVAVRYYNLHCHAVRSLHLVVSNVNAQNPVGIHRFLTTVTWTKRVVQSALSSQLNRACVGRTR